MASKREQILAKIKTNLTGTTGVGTRIYRSRVEPITRDESPSLVLEFVTDEPTVNSATYLKLDWTLRVRIVVVVRSQTPILQQMQQLKVYILKLLAIQL